MTHAFFGKGYTDAEILCALGNAGLPYRRLSEPELLSRVARDLANGKIVGWFQGRSEIGPRALGNRSILADPRNAAMKDRINRLVKHREPFRPFAPAILEERVSEYFEIEDTDPFMTLAPKVRHNKRHVIPAGVHLDGTSRIQTVSRHSNAKFYDLIQAFDELTGVPVLINTSFNYQEPIVQSPAEAIACYLRTSLDALVLGSFYVERGGDPRDTDVRNRGTLSRGIKRIGGRHTQIGCVRSLSGFRALLLDRDDADRSRLLWRGTNYAVCCKRVTPLNLPADARASSR